MAPSSPLGEGRAKSRDHRLPLLEIPFPLCLFLSFFLDFYCPLSPSLSRAFQFAVRRLTPSFLRPLRSKRSDLLHPESFMRARASLAHIPVARLSQSGPPLPGILARFVKSRCRGCDCIDQYRTRRRGFFYTFNILFSLTFVYAHLTRKCTMCHYVIQKVSACC